MRIAYDALNPARIPNSAVMVLGYDEWSAADWSRFKGAQKIRIAQSADQVGKQYSILDVERGDATIEQAPGWIRKQQGAGAIFNTVYVQESNLEVLRRACHGLHYYILLAWWRSSGAPLHVAGTIGMQYAGNVDGGAYDLSAIYDDKWHPTLSM